MTFQIDDTFISKWHPKYDDTENDEEEYGRLVAQVAEDMHSAGTILQGTFLAIWRWKKAIRAIRYVRLDQYEDRYSEAFRRAASELPERKLEALLAPDVKLPGTGAATASTIIHFMHPRSMPILDVRTAEALFEAGLISTKRAAAHHYEEFRKAIEGIRHRCRSRNLREIDRALFAYHKQVLAVPVAASASTLGSVGSFPLGH
jgi:hypothetical protein